jgi:hypothetical protein
MPSTTPSGRQDFLRSEQADDLRTELKTMVHSPLYNTHVVTLIDTDDMYFVDKHMRYMSNHLSMDPWQYVMNLKLMTKINR